MEFVMVLMAVLMVAGLLGLGHHQRHAPVDKNAVHEMPETEKTDRHGDPCGPCPYDKHKNEEPRMGE